MLHPQYETNMDLDTKGWKQEWPRLPWLPSPWSIWEICASCLQSSHLCRIWSPVVQCKTTSTNRYRYQQARRRVTILIEAIDPNHEEEASCKIGAGRNMFSTQVICLGTSLYSLVQWYNERVQQSEMMTWICHRGSSLRQLSEAHGRIDLKVRQETNE